MGIQKKHGKGRLDKWYKLAKEKGYRARAAFKLIQLNRKYGFLEKSKVLLDLCAAPGSWCQVAAQTMPANSLIIGVDLTPIRPIPRTITFQSDITTDKCRATIRQHLKSWKADTVLHDGAPNLGVTWVQDAFSQSELALQALKLATEFLVEGGTFVTKVFRSRDYTALLWVFNQLFIKVEATKPPSSRNVSAEIFVVCRGFKAPKHIDPKFLDPRSVFAELPNPKTDHEAKVFNPEKIKRKRDGCEEGNYTQFKEVSAYEFIQSTDPIAMLGTFNRLILDQPGNEDVALAALDKLPETTPEIRQCCMDLGVLGRKEFRALLRWRLKARDTFGFATKKNGVKDTEEENVVEISAMDEELQIQEDLKKLNEKESSRKKREKRRENERKQKDIVRMQMHMLPPTEIGLEQTGPSGEDSTFSLAAVNKAGAIEKVVRGKMGVLVPVDPSDDSSQTEESDDEEDKLDTQLDTLYNIFQERKSESDAKYRAKRARKEHTDGNWEGFSDGGGKSEDEFQLDADSDFSAEDETHDPLSGPDQGRRNSKSADGLTKRASLFFDQEVFKDLGGLEVESGLKIGNNVKTAILGDDPQLHHSGVTSKAMELVQKTERQAINTGEASSGKKIPSLQGSQNVDMIDKQANIDSNDDEGSTNDFEVVPISHSNDWEKEEEESKKGPVDIDIITAEAMSLAQQIASGQKTTYDLVDDGFNKYAFQDRDGLPEWFLDDEERHNKPLRPITAAGAAAIKEKLRALNARPIKKVREAKDRKKFKAAQRLEKLRKKSALIAGEDGISEKDKAQNIAKLMSKAAKKKPKQQVKLVVAKGGNRGISGRPRGVKGKYKIVDARLKKDVRAEKRLAKKRR